MVTLESLSRESLQITSYLDAYLSSIASVIQGSNNADPFVLRAISASGNALQELALRTVTSLQWLVTLRRDTALYKADLKPQFMASLRHAPFLGASQLFDSDLIRQISAQQLELAKNEALTRAIRASSVQTFKKPAAVSAPRPQPNKRPAAAASSAPHQAKKPRFTPATSTAVNARSQHHKKHR